MPFQLTIHPVRGPGALTVAVQGDVLVLDGEPLDLAAIPEGGHLPREAVDCPWLAGSGVAETIHRTGGVLHVALRRPLPADAPELAWEAAVLALVTDGPVTLPGEEA